MRITLVADIPNDLVTRGVKYGVKCHGQLNHTQTSPQMPTRLRDSRNRLGAQFIGQADQIMIRKPLQIARRGHLIQKRCFRSICHRPSSGRHIAMTGAKGNGSRLSVAGNDESGKGAQALGFIPEWCEGRFRLSDQARCLSLGTV